MKITRTGQIIIVLTQEYRCLSGPAVSGRIEARWLSIPLNSIQREYRSPVVECFKVEGTIMSHAKVRYYT